MGLQMWIARRQVRGIVKALRKHYNQGLSLYPNHDISALCRDVIGSRYQTINPGPIEMAVIQTGIEQVEDFYDAAVLVLIAEANLPDGDGPFLANVIREITYEISRSDGIVKPDQNPDVQDKATDLFHKWKLVKVHALYLLNEKEGKSWSQSSQTMFKGKRESE